MKGQHILDASVCSSERHFFVPMFQWLASGIPGQVSLVSVGAVFFLCFESIGTLYGLFWHHIAVAVRRQCHA